MVQIRYHLSDVFKIWRYSSAVEQWNHNSYVVGSSPTFAKSDSRWWFNNCVF